MRASQPGKVQTPLQSARDATRRVVTHAGVFSFFVNLLMLTGPIYMLQIYDRVLGSRSVETLVVITGLTVVLFVAMGLLDFCRGALLARAGVAFERTLQPLVFDGAMENALVGKGAPEQPMKDLRQIRQFLASPALTAVFDGPWTPIFLGVVFMMHWALGVVGLVGLFVLLTLAIVNERSSRQANTKAQGITSETDKTAMSALRNAAAVEAMGMRATMRERWLGLGGRATGFSVAATDTIGGLTAASKATRLFLQSAILGIGALLAIQGEVTPGVMIAASIITGRALAPIEIVTSQWRNFALTQGAYERLKGHLARMGDPVERTELPAPKGALSAEKLYLQPEGSKKLIVKGVSFAVEAGESVGIIGPSAAGKSTLARALVGVEPIRSGDIRIDGASLTQWDRDALGPHIGYLPQDVELFAGTAAANIARFQKDADPRAIIAAAQAAGAHEMILGFPDGYDTEIGERGAHISAGQRQRLGLARALYGDPALVVLDEPNANLDGEGDAALARAVQSLNARGATTVIIAHRPSAIAYVKKLLLLVEGEVRAFGPRDEILKQMAPKQVETFRQPGADRPSDDTGRAQQTGGAGGAA